MCMTDPPLEDLGDPREMAPFSLEIILLDTEGRRSLRHILLVALADLENGRQKNQYSRGPNSGDNSVGRIRGRSGRNGGGEGQIREGSGTTGKRGNMKVRL